MTKENNKVDINKHEMDIDTLKKQNVNDLLSIKEIYSKLEELGEKITQVKYIDNTLVKKIKKEYENFKKIILDENIQLKLDNKIDEFNLKLTNDIETINLQMDTITKKVNILELKNKNPLLTDTEIFRNAIKNAFDNNTTLAGEWKSGMIIEIPNGVYNIDDTIFDSTLNIIGAKFIFKGYGNQNTYINFTPSTEKFLIDNDNKIGFCSFEGIYFKSNNLGKFMRGTTGNAQNFRFTDCTFSQFKTIIDCNGSTMMSEVTFDKCKIANSDENSKLFILNNSQAVNWRFYATDIESFRGICFECLAGQTIYYYQGSIIPYNATVIHLNSSANTNLFGGGNRPHFAFYGVRFELKDATRLQHTEQANTNFHTYFNSCGMGGLSSGGFVGEKYPLVLSQRGKIIFDNCHNFAHYKMNETIDNNSYTSPKEIIFRNCDINRNEFITNSNGNDVSNVGGYATLNFDGDIVKNRYHSDNIPNLTPRNHYITFHNSEDVLCSISGKDVSEFEIILPQVALRKIQLLKFPISSYGAYQFNFSVFNSDKTKTLLNGTFTMNDDVNDIVFETKDNFKHKLDKINNKIILQFTPISTNVDTVRLNGILNLVY